MSSPETATPMEREVVEIYEKKDFIDTDEHGATFDKARTGQLLRKLDWNIVPFLSLLYL